MVAGYIIDMGGDKMLGERIKKLRVKIGLSQSDLGDLIGVQQTFISAIEKDLKKPSFELLPKIANALKVSVEDLVDKQDNKKESFTIMLIERLIDEGLIQDSEVSQDELNMIIDAIKVDIKRIQKEKGSC